MIPVLIEAALRSLLAGVVVAVGLRLFRIHNVVAQKAAWGLVLAAALAMPWLLPAVGQWQLLPESASIVLPAHPMTLLEELQARILAKSPSSPIPQPNALAFPQGKSIQHEEPDGSAPENARTRPGKQIQPDSAHGQQAASPTEPIADSAGQREDAAMSPQRSRVSVSPSVVAWLLYLVVADGALFEACRWTGCDAPPLVHCHADHLSRDVARLCPAASTRQ